jgi:hypothetical protein
VIDNLGNSYEIVVKIFFHGWHHSRKFFFEEATIQESYSFWSSILNHVTLLPRISVPMNILMGITVLGCNLYVFSLFCLLPKTHNRNIYTLWQTRKHYKLEWKQIHNICMLYLQISDLVGTTSWNENSISQLLNKSPGFNSYKSMLNCQQNDTCQLINTAQTKQYKKIINIITNHTPP